MQRSLERSLTGLRLHHRTLEGVEDRQHVNIRGPAPTAIGVALDAVVRVAVDLTVFIIHAGVIMAVRTCPR